METTVEKTNQSKSVNGKLTVNERIKEMYKKYKTNNVKYHAKEAGINSLEEMNACYNDRHSLLHGMLNLSYAFADDSLDLLDALTEFEKRKGISHSGFRIILNELISLVDQRDKVSQWIHELSSELELLNDINVDKMSESELEEYEN